MEVVYWILMSLVLISEVSILVGLIFCKDKRIRKKYSKTYTGDEIKSKFYLLIPAFDESKGIQTSYEYFSGLASDDIKCVFITTEKETLLYGECKTKKILEKVMIEIPNSDVYLHHYPYTEGNKVAQLNHFIDFHRDELDKDNVFIFDYDCDSRPDMDTIEDMKYIINSRPNLNVIQQNSKFWSINPKSIIMKIEAMFETRWAFGYERFHQYLSTNRIYNNLFVPFAYCIGHGLCIRATYLYKIGKFPMPLEDVPLGMMLILMGEPIYPCVAKDTAEVVPSFQALLRQVGNWVRGPFQAAEVIRKTKKLQKISLYREALFLLRILLDLLSWIQYLTLFLVSIIMILTNSYWYLVIYILALLITSILSLLITSRYYADDRWQVTLPVLVLSPVRHLIRGTSIFSCMYQNTFGWFYDKKKNQ